MTDEDTGTPPPRSGARDPNTERRPSAQSRSRTRRTRDSQAQTGESAAPWQPSFGWFGADDDGSTESSVDFGADLVNLGFIGAALRRSKPFWMGLAVLGLLIGLASWAMRPPTSSATTTLLLTVGPEAQPGTAILNDQAIAQSRGVATIARQELGLHQSVDSLLASYETTVLTDRVLRITVNAPSTSQAVRRANAITSAFLAFRADQLRAQQRLQFASLDNVLTRSQQRLDSIDARIQQVTAQPASDSRQAQLQALQTSRKQARSELLVLKEQVNTAKATAEETTAAMIGQSKVLDAASPLSHSQLKPLLLSSAVGFVAGLVLGLGIVIIRALVSDRLRRRDDIARALGAPVRLSIAAAAVWRRRPGKGGGAIRGRDAQRIVEFLRAALPTGPRCAALAVIPVDGPGVAAAAVASLAESLAHDDARVVVADLCTGSPAAKLLGVDEPGVRAARSDGAQTGSAGIDVVVPEPDDITPIGPFRRTSTRGAPAPAAELAAACASADILLTLTSLDPSVAGDHLRTWAADAVVIVTAGRSSWTKIHAVGELVRLAGTRLVSAVLLGADKWDESLGVTAPTDAGRAVLNDRDHGGTEAAPTHRPAVTRFTS